jgi:hypothetical protein
VTLTTSLASSELRVRWGRAVLAAAVVATAVALSVSLELLGRGRERAVEAQLDAAGPALRIAGPGVTASDVAMLRDVAAPLDVSPHDVRAILGGQVRRIEARAVLRDRERGHPVVALQRSSPAAPKQSGSALVGIGLAERLRVQPRNTVAVLGRALIVDGVLPSSGDASDFAVFVNARDVGEPHPTQIDVYLEPGVDAREAEIELRRALPRAAILHNARGVLVEGGLHQSIAAHRRAVQVVCGLIAALALLIATHLDVSERRRELALLVAVGMRARQIAALVVQRAALCAFAGAVAGVALAALVAAAMASAEVTSVAVVGTVAVLLSVGLAASAAAPVAFVAAVADPVFDLQQG